jgi:hypothetical protein
VNLLITGRLGVGTITLVKTVSEQLRGSLRLAGFTTAEVRDPSGQRTGFRTLTVGGKQAELARVGFRSPVHVGRHGIPPSRLKSEPLCDVLCDVSSPKSTIVPQLAALTEVMCQCDKTRMNIARHAITAHHRYPHFQNWHGRGQRFESVRAGPPRRRQCSTALTRRDRLLATLGHPEW